MMTQDFQPGRAFARTLDDADPLARFRQVFVVAEPDLIYLDGNSLGRLPGRTGERLQELVEKEWGRDLIRGWNAGWYGAPARLGDKLAHLIGAEQGQVVVSDSTSANLFKLVMAALALRPDRKRIISDALNFPSDLYVVQGCSRLLDKGHHLPRPHVGIGQHPRPREPRRLPPPRRLYPLADGRRGLPQTVVRQLFVLYPGHLDVGCAWSIRSSSGPEIRPGVVYPPGSG